jgi:putative FmdB family regulatory protein
MPTYEYRCEKCGERFEVFQSFSDRALRRHPDCGGPVEKVIHPSGIVFKGSGFYVTDSRAKSSSATESGGSNGSSSDKAPSGDSGSGEKSGSGEGSKSDRSKASEGSKGEKSRSGEGSKSEKSRTGERSRNEKSGSGDGSRSGKPRSGEKSSTSAATRD